MEAAFLESREGKDPRATGSRRQGSPDLQRNRPAGGKIPLCAHEHVLPTWDGMGLLLNDRPTRSVAQSSSRIRRLLAALIRSWTLGATKVARLLVGHWSYRRWHAPPRLRPSTD